MYTNNLILLNKNILHLYLIILNFMYTYPLNYIYIYSQYNLTRKYFLLPNTYILTRILLTLLTTCISTP